MKRLALTLTLLFAACGDFSSGTCEDDPNGRHHAVNPATGDCWEFASSCDVPADWASCGGEPECDAMRACPPDRICQEGVCVLVEGGCTSDLDCPDTQHCEFTMPAPEPTPPDIAATGTCVNNATCTDDTQCPIGQWCDWTAGDCDPSLPDCGIASGVCSRGPRPGTCATDADCMGGWFCMAPINGEPVCKLGCTADTPVCDVDEYCTIDEGICLSPPANSGGGAPVPGVCYGWCATRAGLCDNAYEDCQLEEVCTSEWTGMPPGTCEPACYDSSTCQVGTHCNTLDGVCVMPHWKRDTGAASGGKKGGASGGSSASEADSDALIPICAGWCVP